MGRHVRWLILIVLIGVFAIWVSLPTTRLTNIPSTCFAEGVEVPEQGIQIDANNDCISDITVNVKQSLGLDLVGGLRILLQSELSPDNFTPDELQQAANNVARRVNAIGVTEPTVQVQGNNRILVELPGITNAEEAVSTIQQTALLEFVNFTGISSSDAQVLENEKILTSEQSLLNTQREIESDQTARVSPITGQPFETVLTGANLQAASAAIGQDGRWLINFEMTPEGAGILGEYTGRNIGQPLAIVLDGILLSAPTIQAQISNSGVITGDFTEEEAEQLALQLRSGALPIPLKVETSERVGATLGQESVNLSIRAGVIGVIIVLLFMLIYYRIPGIAADLALLVFIVINLAIFKLVPITVTLPAIVGFLISIGTAVDGNILIFERIKEELRAGKSLMESLDNGFDRAWQSIRESNLSTIIICAILFLFGQTPGASIVSGFAVTLALGLIINLFTATIVTRTFLYLLANSLGSAMQQQRWLMSA
jgi:protein-export membrane protein SecD